MAMTPFGVLNSAHKKSMTGLFTPMYEWPDTPQAFKVLLARWIAEVAESIWPAWDPAAGWTGNAAAQMEDATRAELNLAVYLYYGGDGAADILDQSPDVPLAEDRQARTHRWHYNIEDALVIDPKYKFLSGAEAAKPSFDYRASSTIGSNYLIYEKDFDIKKFEGLFWGRMRGLQPPIWDIKQHFQRPRPWTAAMGLGVEGFRWITADGITHTGVHPAILSGHCIQGILGGCAVFDALLTESRKTGVGLTADRITAIQQYMVDWGDRRVFAGVHYMTDNIASWTLARRLIPRLFGSNAQEVENFAVAAITRRSRVFADVVRLFGSEDPKYTGKLPNLPLLGPALKMLRAHFPEEATTV